LHIVIIWDLENENKNDLEMIHYPSCNCM